MSPLRPEPAGGAQEDETIDHVAVIGRQLPGDAAAGRETGHVNRPDFQ